jgi:hypothetical protein
MEDGLRTFRAIAHGLVSSAALLGAACGDQGPAGLGPCTAAVALSVGAGPQPTLDWRPACAAASIMVTPAGEGGAVPVWAVMAPLGALTPPVRVGASPPGAQVFGAGVSLTPGAPYTVYVTRGGRGDPAAGVDSLTFTAQP